MAERQLRRTISVRLPADVVEALDETADEVVCSRSKLVELAVVEYLSRLDLPPGGPRG